MRVHLTFDVEVWCNGWTQLDEVFPAQYERYVNGRSEHGDFALPATLEILGRHGLKGVFFVEPLFSARFGARFLDRIVEMISAGGHEVQLHVHPEWVDEIDPPVIENNRVKRQHISYYDLDEQVAIVAYAKDLLAHAGQSAISAFRAGSYAADRNTFEALRRNGIVVDSSLNHCADISGADLRTEHSLLSPSLIGGVSTYPITVFRDGFGRLRPAQVGACSFEEMRDALEDARAAGAQDFVIVSHNFEMLKPGSVEPDFIVARRFERLCAYLSQQQDRLPVCGYATAPLRPAVPSAVDHDALLPRAGLLSTTRRHIEQLRRRLS